jgi:Outer membrane protein beta-barrel domain
MKKLLLLAFLLIISIEGFSQSGTFGVRGGYNISNLDFDVMPANTVNKHRNSIYIGFFADYRLSNTVSVVPEIQFSAEGAKTETLHLDYIQAPIILKFKLSPRVRLGVGPQVGLKVHKYEDGVRNFAYSAVAGAEYKINEVLFLDVRYTYGISNIFDDYLNVEAKNRNVQIGVGYQF